MPNDSRSEVDKIVNNLCAWLQTIHVGQGSPANRKIYFDDADRISEFIRKPLTDALLASHAQGYRDGLEDGAKQAELHRGMDAETALAIATAIRKLGE